MPFSPLPRCQTQGVTQGPRRVPLFLTLCSTTKDRPITSTRSPSSFSSHLPAPSSLLGPRFSSPFLHSTACRTFFLHFHFAPRLRNSSRREQAIVDRYDLHKSALRFWVFELLGASNNHLTFSRARAANHSTPPTSPLRPVPSFLAHFLYSCRCCASFFPRVLGLTITASPPVANAGFRHPLLNSVCYSTNSLSQTRS